MRRNGLPPGPPDRYYVPHTGAAPQPQNPVLVLNNNTMTFPRCPVIGPRTWWGFEPYPAQADRNGEDIEIVPLAMTHLVFTLEADGALRKPTRMPRLRGSASVNLSAAAFMSAGGCHVATAIAVGHVSDNVQLLHGVGMPVAGLKKR